MLTFRQFYRDILDHPQLTGWLTQGIATVLAQWAEQVSKGQQHGDFVHWQRCIAHLPQATAERIELNQSAITAIGQLAQGEQQRLAQLLRQLMPWRKGPFDLYGLYIDCEWRSDWKWQRLLPHISDLTGKTVLDVGCGSGYHLWRMQGAGAKLAIGIDPTALFFCQFQAVHKLLGAPAAIHLLPLPLEALPASGAFDSVFSMGVLYHRLSPLEHLQQLKAQLIAGGQLILETLVIDGDEQQLLMPSDRYAQMRNVYFIPSSAMLMQWLAKIGFINIKLVDETTTSLDEQRATDWMTNQSLSDFLDPLDRQKTIEGYPAPKRAIVIANKG